MISYHKNCTHSSELVVFQEDIGGIWEASGLLNSLLRTHHVVHSLCIYPLQNSRIKPMRDSPLRCVLLFLSCHPHAPRIALLQDAHCSPHCCIDRCTCIAWVPHYEAKTQPKGSSGPASSISWNHTPEHSHPQESHQVWRWGCLH